MRFREKTPTQINTSTKYTFEDGSVYQHSVHEDFFFRSFVDNYILRDNCYQCSYSQIKRVSDITIADFWGYSPKRFRFRDYEKGVSIIIINTDKGQELFNQVKSQLKYEERDIKENYNQNLHAPQVKPKDYDDYWKDYLSGNDCAKYFEPRKPYKKAFSTTRREYMVMLLPQWFFRFGRGLKKILRI